MAVILIVEDEAQVLLLAESYLQEQGHETLSAGSVAEAMVLIEKDSLIDVLFTDVELRDDPHGGLNLAKQAVERRADLKVLYTTGQTVTSGMRALFVEGAALLEKPYTVDQLATALAHLIIKPLRREN